ncbi:MAG: hypothetical protein P4L56_17680 [Candidatus Sulfopaludibacter sp.]|nr:hypothetical protein [Candidatus Sulfopaludibacter sp.]
MTARRFRVFEVDWHSGELRKQGLRLKLWDQSFHLRDALGDSAESPRFIETLPKRGYRYIAPVDAGHPNGHPLEPTPEP